MRNFALFLVLMLTGCATVPGDYPYKESPPKAYGTPTGEILNYYDHLDQEVITVAVYQFADKTGQRKPSTKFSQLSMAVSQGADVWVIQALKETGDGTWFRVVERASLGNLVKERQLIRSTTELYDGSDKGQAVLKPMLFAGLLFEGAIVGYDANVESGGDGARYFGIGIHEEYRVDQVTVSMRIVSVHTGEIMIAVSSTKSIASFKTGRDVFKFLDMGTKALELESGAAVNEPVNYALRSAIEHCILQILDEGKIKGLWKTKLRPHGINGQRKNK